MCDKQDQRTFASRFMYISLKHDAGSQRLSELEWLRTDKSES